MNNIQNTFEQLIDQVVENSYAVVDHFLKAEIIEALLAQLQELQAGEQLKKAGIGQLIEREVDGSIRGDQIHWLKKNSSQACEMLFNKQIEALSAYLNRTCFLSLNDYEFHYTCYPPGTFYKRHIDQFHADRSRLLSVILYLNKNWKPGDGGEIMLYPQGKEEICIQPTWGRMVCFKSDELEHEVLPTRIKRYSITGWLKSVSSENVIQLID